VCIVVDLIFRDGNGDVVGTVQGGWFALQMPLNHTQPSHESMVAASHLPAFAEYFADFKQQWTQRDVPFYTQLLNNNNNNSNSNSNNSTSNASWQHVCVEERVYRQVVKSPSAIASMLQSTGLRPFMLRVPEVR